MPEVRRLVTDSETRRAQELKLAAYVRDGLLADDIVVADADSYRRMAWGAFAPQLVGATSLVWPNEDGVLPGSSAAFDGGIELPPGTVEFSGLVVEKHEHSLTTLLRLIGSAWLTGLHCDHVTHFLIVVNSRLQARLESLFGPVYVPIGKPQRVDPYLDLVVPMLGDVAGFESIARSTGHDLATDFMRSSCEHATVPWVSVLR